MAQQQYAQVPQYAQQGAYQFAYSAGAPPPAQSADGGSPDASLKPGLVLAAKPDTAVKLFIGQIPRTMTEQDLAPVFSEVCFACDITIIRDRATGASRGCAFVTVATKQDADRAIAALDNIKTLPPMGRPLQIKIADSEQERFVTKLFVGMIPKNATEADVQQVFAPYGKVEELCILRQGGVSRGCGFVRFAERKQAENAIAALNGVVRMEGSAQPLAVRFADTEKAKQQRQMQRMGMQPGPQHMMPMWYGSGYPGMVPGAPAAAGAAGRMPPQMGMGMGMMPMAATGMPGHPAAGARQEGPPGANLFIYHLPPEARDVDLVNLFAPYGNVISAKVFVDKLTSTSKCFGFVSYDNPASAVKAISSMDGFNIQGRRLKVQQKRTGGDGTTGAF